MCVRCACRSCKTREREDACVPVAFHVSRTNDFSLLVERLLPCSATNPPCVAIFKPPLCKAVSQDSQCTRFASLRANFCVLRGFSLWSRKVLGLLCSVSEYGIREFLWSLFLDRLALFLMYESKAYFAPIALRDRSVREFREELVQV